MANMKYLNQYEKENIRQIRLKINRKTEPEMLEWIEKQGNIQGYIKQLILEDMRKGRENMKMDRMITVDSFGAECPKNWEEIAEFLNRIIEEHEPEEDEWEENEWHADLWERYCRGEIPGAPKAIMEE